MAIHAVTSLILCAAILTGLTSGDHRKPATGDGREAKGGGDEECELRVLVASHAPKRLTSPNHPGPYPSHADCRWLLTAPDDHQTLAVRIVTLDIESDRECRLDSLRLYSGSSPESSELLGDPLCGRIRDRLLRTHASTVLLAFRSDAAYEEAGFEIEYFVDDEDDRGGGGGGVCGGGGTAAVGRGWLTSPGFPGPYPDGVDCWRWVGGGDGPVTLTFEWLDLEDGGDNCTFDYVRLWEGNDTSAAPLAVLCGQSEGGGPFRSPSSLLVHFHSDGSVNRKGFRARYRTGRRGRTSPPLGGCGWEEGESGGTFSSPGHPSAYPSLARCSLRIVAPDDSRRILVTIDALLLELDSNCSYDFLRIEDPSSEGDPQTFCGRLSEPRHLVSDGPELQVEFRSDDFVEFLGFKLRYEFFGGGPEGEEEGRTGEDPPPFDRPSHPGAEREEEEEEEEDPAPFRFSSRPDNATLTPGATHDLNCATRHPNAKIRWLKEEAFLAGDGPLPGLRLLANDTLRIESMAPELAGTYTCVAVAPEGVITARASLLSTEEEPPCKIEVSMVGPPDPVLDEGEFALFECSLGGGGGGDPPPWTVRWSKDGSPPEGHVTVLKNGYLFVDGVRPRDSGRYECSARDPRTGCEGRASRRLEVRRRTSTEDVCGKPSVQGAGNEHAKIVGGNDALKGAYPWQVMLWEPKGGPFCGGTLLNERWISTAAHCLKRRGISLPSVRILLGKHDRERREESEVETRIADSAHAVVYHPDFDGRTYDNDLALVRMRRRIIPYTDHVMPVCLGDRRLSESLLEGGARMGWVTGWGQLKEKGPSPRYLQEIKVPVVDQEVCRASTPLTVTRNMFCAGYAQEVIGDACQGDSGGAFLVRNEEDGRWYMVGVVSWGEGCGKTGKYGFYTKVANHLAWIRGIIKS